MADNTTLPAGSGGDTISTDDLGTVKVQRVKVQYGVDGSATDVSTTNPLPVSLANTGANSTAVKVDGSAVTQPVSGTFWQATQPVSAASLPLPTGAATSAKQPALGTAGTPSSDVITVQGATSMTALKVDASATTQPVSGTVTANAGTNLNTSALALETGGNLATTATNTTGLNNVVGTAASAVPSQLIQIGGSDGTNARAVKTNSSGQLDVRPLTSSDQVTTVPSGTQTVSGAVTANVGTTNGLALDATLTGGNQQVQGNAGSAATDSGNPVKIGGKFNTTRPTFTDGQRGDIQIDARGNIATMAFNGANPASYGADNADAVATTSTADKQRMISRPSVYNGTTYDRMYAANAAAGTTGTGLLGAGALGFDGTNYQKIKTDTTGIVSVTDKPATSGGLSIVTGSVGGTATAIKASAGQLYGYHLFNTTAAVAYVQIFNVAAASVTLGTTSPTISIGIPASGGVTVNFDKGIAFGTAISFACTTTRTGSTGATCDVNFFYN